MDLFLVGQAMPGTCAQRFAEIPWSVPPQKQTALQSGMPGEHVSADTLSYYVLDMGSTGKGVLHVNGL